MTPEPKEVTEAREALATADSHAARVRSAEPAEGAVFAPKDIAAFIGVSRDHLRATLAHIDTLTSDLRWHEEAHGTRAEQEAQQEADRIEGAAIDAEIDAMTDEDIEASLAEDGIDYDRARKKIDTVIRLCGERSLLQKRLAEVERERDDARTQVGACEYADEEIRRQYGAEFGLLDPDDSPPCWADFAEHIRTVTKERDEARAEVGRLAKRDGLAASWCPTDGAELTGYGCCDVCGYEDRTSVPDGI